MNAGIERLMYAILRASLFGLVGAVASVVLFVALGGELISWLTVFLFFVGWIVFYQVGWIIVLVEAERRTVKED